MRILGNLPPRVRRALAVAGVLLLAGVIALVAVTAASSGSGNVTATPAKPPASHTAAASSSSRQSDPTHGAVTQSVQSALAEGGYFPRHDQNPVPVTNDDYTPGTAWVFVKTNGTGLVYVVNNGLRKFVQGDVTCEFHPAISGEDFAVALLDATNCVNQGGTQTPMHYDLLDNVRQTTIHMGLTGSRNSVSADFTEAGGPLPQTKMTDAQKLRAAGYRVTGTHMSDGTIQQWSKTGYPSFYAYVGSSIMAVGTPAGWCKVPGGTIAAMLTVANACLAQGHTFTASDAGLKEAWLQTPFGNEVVAYHPGAYFDYKP